MELVLVNFNSSSDTPFNFTTFPSEKCTEKHTSNPAILERIKNNFCFRNNLTVGGYWDFNIVSMPTYSRNATPTPKRISI